MARWVARVSHYFPRVAVESLHLTRRSGHRPVRVEAGSPPLRASLYSTSISAVQARHHSHRVPSEPHKLCGRSRFETGARTSGG